MEPRFNIDRPAVNDEEIDKHKDFDKLLEKFKQQSLQKARSDRSWWRNKRVRYSTVIAGVAVVCTITYLAISNQNKKTNETLTTQNQNQNTTQPATSSQEQETRNEKPGTRNFINPPSKKLAVAYSSYKVNNSKGGEIKHHTASKIRIPKNSFVDKNGHDIVGDVTIEYREFHDHSDIIASGIPMAYDSAGRPYNLESAGMFDIKGSQDGEPVFIKDGKKVDVEMASASAENKFNQYYLDTLKKNWEYIKRDTPSKNKETGQKPKENNIAQSENPKMEKLKKDIEVVIPKRIDSVQTVYTRKMEVLPKPKEPFKPLKPSGKQTFNIDASPKDFPELSSFSNLLFEIGDENKNYTKEMNEITWNDVKISEGPQKGKNYLLTLRYMNRVEKLVVYPVLSGADYDKAEKKYQQKFGEYQALLEKRQSDETKLKEELEAKRLAYEGEMKRKQEEYERVRAEIARQRDQQMGGFSNLNFQSKATRVFQVAKFGIYNSDCPHAATEGQSVKPVFLLSSSGKVLVPESIFLVSHDENSVYNLQKNMPVNYKADGNYSFVVFRNERVYLCNKKSFRESSESESGKFTVTELSQDADDISGLRKALEI